jgi:hypothetical protein
VKRARELIYTAERQASRNVSLAGLRLKPCSSQKGFKKRYQIKELSNREAGSAATDNLKNPLSLDEFLNPEDKVIVNEDEDIFTSVVDHYTVVSPGEKEESSDEEEVKEVNTAKALRAVETVKMWKLQKGDSQDL